MLEFRISSCGNYCTVKETIRGIRGSKITEHDEELVDLVFKKEWYKKHHQHKIDSILETCSKKELARKQVFYVSGDASMRGDGIHYE